MAIFNRPSQAKDEARYPAENIMVVEGNVRRGGRETGLLVLRNSHDTGRVPQVLLKKD